MYYFLFLSIFSRTVALPIVLDGLASTSEEAKKPNAGIITNNIGIF